MVRGPVEQGIRGDRVRALRKQLKMSQDDVVDKMAEFGAQIHQTYLSAIEAGGRGLNPDALKSLSEVLLTSPGYLLGLTDDPRPHKVLEYEVSVHVADERERELVQQLFKLIEDLDPEMRQGYYDALSIMYEGLMARARQDAERSSKKGRWAEVETN